MRGVQASPLLQHMASLRVDEHFAKPLDVWVPGPHDRLHVVGFPRSSRNRSTGTFVVVSSFMVIPLRTVVVRRWLRLPGRHRSRPDVACVGDVRAGHWTYL